MEFGIFLNGYIPGPAAHDTYLEHEMFRREAEYTELADKHNWKYAWFGEHHSLTEYSHLSASEVMIGYCAWRWTQTRSGWVWSPHPSRSRP